MPVGHRTATPNDDDNLLHELDSCEALLSFVMDDLACDPAFKEAINYLAEGVDDACNHSISYDREARVDISRRNVSWIDSHCRDTERIITAATVTSERKATPYVGINKTEQAGVVVIPLSGCCMLGMST